MFRWIVRGIGIFGVIFAAGVLAAYVYGTSRNDDVITFSLSNSGASFRDRDLRLIDVNTRLQVPVNLPIAEDDMQEFAIWSIGSGPELLLFSNHTLNPEVFPFSERNIRYSTQVYNIASGETRTLISYTRRNITQASILYPMGGNLAYFWQFDPANPNLIHWVAIYHRTLGKLFIFDETYTLQNTIAVEMNPGTGTLSVTWSPDASQLAIKLRPGLLLIINRDGSQPRYFPVPDFHDFVTQWSRDGREILITAYNDWTLRPIRILDVETGQWREDVARIEGHRATWACKSKWLRYDTAEENAPPNLHMLHIESGRVIHLNNHPQLREIENIASISTRDCKYWMIAANRQPSPTQPFSTTDTLYVADFDFSNLRHISDNAMSIGVNYFSTEAFTYQTTLDDKLNVIYQQRYDGTGEREIVGYFPTDVDLIYSYYDNYRRGIYIQRDSTYVSNLSGASPTTTFTIYVVNLETGEKRALYETTNIIGLATSLYSDA